jgi:hypothetical protein
VIQWSLSVTVAGNESLAYADKEDLAINFGFLLGELMYL